MMPPVPRPMTMMAAIKPPVPAPFESELGIEVVTKISKPAM